MRTIKIILGISLAVLFSACNNGNGDYDASGVFESTEVIVSAEANGKIMELTLQEGQPVSPSAPVGYIDTVQLFLKKQQLLASMGAVQSRRQSVPRQVAAIQEQIAKLKREQKRYENLVQLNAANQKQLDDLQAERLVAEKQLEALQENLHNSNSSLAGEATSLDLQVAQLEDRIRKSIIASPIAGTVLAKYAEEGELATIGKALFKVADVSHLYLRVYITPGQLTEIKTGPTVKAYRDSDTKDRREYVGTVTWIADQS